MDPSTTAQDPDEDEVFLPTDADADDDDPPSDFGIDPYVRESPVSRMQRLSSQEHILADALTEAEQAAERLHGQLDSLRREKARTLAVMQEIMTNASSPIDKPDGQVTTILERIQAPVDW